MSTKVSNLEVVFSVNGKTVALSAEALQRMVDYIPDTPECAEIYNELSKSSSFEIRQEVANKDNLTEETVFRLISDPVEEVAVNILRSEAAKYFTDKQLLDLIDKNPRIAAQIADNISRYESADIKKLAEKLVAHPDPVVRKNIAGNWETPKPLLKKMLKDADPDVVAAAKNILD